MGMVLPLGHLPILRDILGFYSRERLLVCGTEGQEEASMLNTAQESL